MLTVEKFAIHHISLCSQAIKAGGGVSDLHYSSSICVRIFKLLVLVVAEILGGGILLATSVLQKTKEHS